MNLVWNFFSGEGDGLLGGQHVQKKGSLSAPKLGSGIGLVAEEPGQGLDTFDGQPGDLGSD